MSASGEDMVTENGDPDSESGATAVDEQMDSTDGPAADELPAALTLVPQSPVTNGSAVAITPLKSTRSAARIRLAATPVSQIHGSNVSDSTKKQSQHQSNGSAKISTPRNKQNTPVLSAPVIVTAVPERRLVVFPANVRIRCTRSELLKIPEKVTGADFGPGDMVWAKSPGFPYWPCLITTDPLEAVYAKTDVSGDLVYHFQFFGSEAARAWTKDRNVFAFDGVDKYRQLSEAAPPATASGRKARSKPHDKYAVDRKDRKKWEYAAAEATFAMTMSVTERLEAFTFDYRIEDENDGVDVRKRKSETPKTPSGPTRKRSKKSTSPEDVFDFNDEDEEPETPTTLVRASPLLLTSAKKKGDLNIFKKREKPVLKKSTPKASDTELDAILEKKWGLMDDSQRYKYADRGEADVKEKESEPPIRLPHSNRTVQPKTPAILIAKKTAATTTAEKKMSAVSKRLTELNDRTPRKESKSPASTPAPSQRPVRTPKSKQSVVVPEKPITPAAKVVPTPVKSESTAAARVSKPQSDQESQSDEVRSVGSGASEELNSVSDITSDDGSESSKPAPAEVCHTCFEKIDIGVESIRCTGPCLRVYEKKCIADLSADTLTSDWKCPDCTSSLHPCFICHVTPAPGNEATVKCSDASCGRFYHKSCLKSHPHKELAGSSGEDSTDSSFTCPLHFCLSCHNDHYEDNVFRTVKRPLLTCIKCPTAYHLLDDCVAAGTTVVVEDKYIICPEHQEKKKSARNKHINVSFCFACLGGGSLTCCDRCPAAFHAECLEAEFAVHDDRDFLCGSCLKRRQLRYGDIVWVKIGAFRWWPAKIVHPLKTPDNVMNMKWLPGQFPVLFFGTNDYNWTEQARAFPYEEGDSRKPLTSHGSSKTDKDFKKALQEAKEAYEKYKAEKSSALAKKVKTFPPYNRIRTNRAIGKVQLQDEDETSGPTNKCDCDPESENPCGSDTDCLNRMMMFECNSKNCKVGDKCRNQRFRKREYVKAKPFNTVQRGWGLRAQEEIKKGDFVIEYVGEIVDEEECKRRLEEKTATNDSNFYFLTIDKDRIIDAGPSGNLARFMNHSCHPNCETQKWVVNGSTKVGLFAVEDIPKGTELTFHYNLDCRGKTKSVCTCGAKNCAGFL